MPVWGVIDPGVEAATRVSRSGSVGDHRDQGHDRAAARIRAGWKRGDFACGRRRARCWCTSWKRACRTAPEAEMLVRHYLKGRPEIDTLILGCTHYPLLREAIARAVGPGVTLVDSADVTAERVSAAFRRRRGVFSRVACSTM